MKDALGHGSDPTGAAAEQAPPPHPRGAYTREQRQAQINELADKMKAIYGDKFDRGHFVQVANKEFPTAAKKEPAAHQGKTDVVTRGTSLPSGGRHGYNAAAVNNAIASSNRSGRKIGAGEASRIHRLLRGR
jgi:hypothetical protein